MKKKKTEDEKPILEVSCLPSCGLPETAFEMVNNYGTYNIQPTADTENMYPAIAHGFNKKIIKSDCENADAQKYFKE